MDPRDPIAAVTHPDPYPYYDALQRRPGLQRDAALKLWIAADAATVSAVFVDPHARVRPAGEPVPAAIAGTPAGALFGQLVRMNDGARHDVPKRVLEQALAALPASQVDACARRIALARAADLMDPDRLSAWAMDTPVCTIAALLGWDDDAARQVAADVREFVACLSPLATPAQLERASVAASRLTARMATLLQAPSPSVDGLAARTLADARAAGWHDEAAVVANLVGLLSQTCEATAGLVGNTLVALATQPARREAARTSQGWSRVVEETSCLDPAVHNTRRFIAQPTRIGDVALAAGDAVLLVLAAAGRGLGFGHGAHACPGRSLACRIAGVALQAVFDTPGHDERLRGLAWHYRPSVNTRVPVFRR